MFEVVVLLFSVSLCLNFWLFSRLRKPEKQVTYDAQALLHDLLGGTGLIKVERVAPVDVFLRSPK